MHWLKQRRQQRSAELAAAIAVAIVKAQEKRTFMVDGKAITANVNTSAQRQIERLVQQLAKR